MRKEVKFYTEDDMYLTVADNGNNCFYVGAGKCGDEEHEAGFIASSGELQQMLIDLQKLVEESL